MNRYLWPGQVYLGAGAAGLTGAQAQALGCRRAFLIVDPGLLPAGLLPPVADSLTAAGVQITLFDQVTPNPDTAAVDAAVRVLRASGADVIVGLGGGSALDTAKAVRLAAGGPAAASVWEYAYLHGEQARSAPARRACLPLIVLPTTAGTGAEATPWAVLTHVAGHHKYGVGANHLMPDIILIDPDLTLSLPPGLTAATGIDALSHLIEAYVSTNQNPLLDPLILRGVALVGQHLRRAVQDGRDRAARQGMMEAALLGGIAITSNWLGACHSLAHQLSSFAGLHHGVAIALMLPGQMTYSLPAATVRYAALGRALTADPTADPVAAVRDLIAAVGLPARLRDAGVDENLIPAMAASAYANDLNWTTNPRPIDQTGLEGLYREAW